MWTRLNQSDSLRLSSTNQAAWDGVWNLYTAQTIKEILQFEIWTWFNQSGSLRLSSTNRVAWYWAQPIRQLETEFEICIWLNQSGSLRLSLRCEQSFITSKTGYNRVSTLASHNPSPAQYSIDHVFIESCESLIYRASVVISWAHISKNSRVWWLFGFSSISILSSGNRKDLILSK